MHHPGISQPVESVRVTFAERVQALAPFGFTERQAAFVATVALHSGYCLRRQYAAFTGLRYGHNVRDFLDDLVARNFARRFTYRRDRGHIYHLFARRLYAAIGQDDNRNRRHASPALLARKLMLLDFVLSQSTRDWYVTENEKVDLFTRTLRVPVEALPRRTYDAVCQGAAATVRYCIQKLPIFLTADPTRVHFVCLVTDPAARDIDLFVREHQALLTQLPAYQVVVVRPAYLSSDARCLAAWNRAMRTSPIGPEPLDAESLRWYLAARRRIELGELGALSVADIQRYRACRTRAPRTLDALYSRWVAEGAPPLDSLERVLARPSSADANPCVIVSLPFRYEQFGSLPGVA